MRARQEHIDTLAVALLLACCIFWGAQNVLIKATVGEVPPLWQAAIRFAGATVLLWVWCIARRIPLFTRDGTLAAGALAGALFAGEFSCIYLGLHDTTASRLTVFLYTSPFVVALFLPRFVAAEKLRGVQWLGLAIAFAAVAFAFSEGFRGETTWRQLRGDALGLAGGILWGLTTLVIRATKLATATPEKTLFYQVAVTALIAPLLSLAMGETWSLQYSAFAWTSLAVQTAAGAFVSYLTWMWLLRHYPATRMSSFTFITPVCALVFGVVLLHEPLTSQLAIGLAGVTAGIVLVNRRAGARRTAARA